MTEAIPIEVRKIGYRQSTKDGMVISFAVHPEDMRAEVAAAGLGTRYMMALVEIGDDEKPVPTNAQKAINERGNKRAWAGLPPATQAGIRCGEKAFQVFVAERGYAPDDLGPEVSGEDIARAGILHYCGVKSRADLSTDSHKAALWSQMDGEYEGWKRGIE